VPSIWPDTFPTVAIESCAYSVPVIATRVGGLPEIIHDGINGLLIEPLDDISLSDAIMNLYEDKTLLHSLSENSREIILPSSIQEISRVQDTCKYINAPYKIFVYIDSIGCTSCKLQLYKSIVR